MITIKTHGSQLLTWFWLYTSFNISWLFLHDVESLLLIAICLWQLLLYEFSSIPIAKEWHRMCVIDTHAWLSIWNVLGQGKFWYIKYLPSISNFFISAIDEGILVLTNFWYKTWLSRDANCFCLFSVQLEQKYLACRWKDASYHVNFDS